MRMLGERIRTARRKVGLSQEALAASLGVQRSAVSNWECAEGASPTVTNMLQLAKTTQVAFEWLATGRGPMALAHDSLLDVSAVDADLVDDPQERRLLHAYRSASTRMRATLLELVEEMAMLRTGNRVKPPPFPVFPDE